MRKCFSFTTVALLLTASHAQTPQQPESQAIAEWPKSLQQYSEQQADAARKAGRKADYRTYLPQARDLARQHTARFKEPELHEAEAPTLALLYLESESANQVPPGVGANTEDPKRVLRAANEALRAVRSVSYDAAYQGTGSFATQSLIAAGKVRIAKLAAGNPLTAKLAAEGQSIPAGADQTQAFHAAFDGQTIRKLQLKDSTLVERTIGTDPKERDLGIVTGFFGGAAHSLLLFEYIMDHRLTRQADAPVAEYEGRASVAGVLCHVVYLEYDPRRDGRVRRERWLIGVKDNLPRQFEVVTVNDKGRPGAYVLTLSNVQANPPPDALAFTIKLPEGYKVKAYERPNRPALLAVGDPAPNWKLRDAKGKVHTAADYRGKLVVLDFWATWCGPCVQGMPGLQKLHGKYRERGVEIIGVNVWEESNAAAYMKEKGYNYVSLLEGEAVAEAYHISVLPTLYVIGIDGKIIHRGVGSSAEELAVLIEQQLKERRR